MQKKYLLDAVERYKFSCRNGKENCSLQKEHVACVGFAH